MRCTIHQQSIGPTGLEGFLPIYIGYSFRPVYITAIINNEMGSVNQVFFPFGEVLIPCLGTSIAFVLEISSNLKIVLFEYNLDICMIGLLGGLTS